MVRNLFLPLIFLLSSCDSDTKNDVDIRDLSTSISFTELIDKRMKQDDSVDGQFVLITSEVNAYFNQNEGCADNPIAPPICNDETYVTEVSEPEFSSGSGIGSCSGYGVELTNSDFTEKLNIDLDTNPEFFVLNEEYNIPVNFYAKVEFVERNVYCSDQVNYGLNLTIQEGEEEYLLEQLK